VPVFWTLNLVVTVWPGLVASRIGKGEVVMLKAEAAWAVGERAANKSTARPASSTNLNPR
jgi:hypothetical protein